MKKNIVPILMMSLTYLGVQYAFSGPDDVAERVLNIAIAFIWGISFHFAAKYMFPEKYVFGNQKASDK